MTRAHAWAVGGKDGEIVFAPAGNALIAKSEQDAIELYCRRTPIYPAFPDGERVVRVVIEIMEE